MDAQYPDKAFYMFDKLLEQPGCLFKIDTPQPEKIYHRLYQYQDYTGKAFYYWKNGQGIHRTSMPAIYTPNTGDVLKALQHVSMSIHFGIYLFTDIGNILQYPSAVKIIEHLATHQTKNKKLLIFAGEDLLIPESIERHFTEIKHKVPPRRVTNITLTKPNIFNSYSD